MATPRIAARGRLAYGAGIPTAPTAPLYNALPYPGDGVVRTPVAKTLARALEHHLPSLARRPALSILDVGCGTGETTLGIARLFPQATVTGVDINPPSLAKARELAAREGSAVEFRKADILADDPSAMCPAGPVDVAVSMGVLGFRAVRQVVKPDGRSSASCTPSTVGGTIRSPSLSSTGRSTSRTSNRGPTPSAICDSLAANPSWRSPRT